jgi:hypothetical protein
VIERGLLDADSVQGLDGLRSVERHASGIVTVPDGRLRECARVALVAHASLSEAVAS